MTNALPGLDNFIGAANRIIKDKCGGNNNNTGDTRNNRIFLDVECRYFWCVIFRKSEKKFIILSTLKYHGSKDEIIVIVHDDCSIF